MTDARGDLPGEAPETPVPPPLTRRGAAAARLPQAEPAGPGFQEQMRQARSEFESQVAHARAEFDQANERIKQRTGRDLILAIVIGVALVVVLILSLFVWKWLFVLFALSAAVLGMFEFSRALRGAGRRVDLVPQIAAGSLLVISGWFVPTWALWVVTISAVAIVVVWRLIAQMAAHDGRRHGEVLQDVLAAGFIQLYIPLLAGLGVLLLRQDTGELWIFTVIGIAIVADTGAYIAGLSFGKHPMAPRISPKKTWEGFAGATVAALGVGVVLAVFLLHLPWWSGLLIGAATLVTATIGDLGESMIKRDIGIKDMSSWIPGHGGVLDRLDSILPSVVAALILFHFLSPLAAA